MAGLSLHQPWVFTFGILGNIISFMVYLAPLPTFYRIYRNKSAKGFQSVPYAVALFSSMLWIYYALNKTDACLLITINSFGCIIEAIYIVIYLKYALRSDRIFTLKIILLLNVGMFGLILLPTLLLSKGSIRVRILGWICMAFAVSVFVAPLSIIKLVIQTKSVEFMPFPLSMFLTLSAVVWFFYGLLQHDKFIFIPNIFGFLFGVAQMVLYLIYKNASKVIEEHDNPEHKVTIDRIGGTSGSEVHPIEVMLEVLDEGQTEDEDKKRHRGADVCHKAGMEAKDEIEIVPSV